MILLLQVPVGASLLIRTTIAKRHLSIVVNCAIHYGLVVLVLALLGISNQVVVSGMASHRECVKLLARDVVNPLKDKFARLVVVHIHIHSTCKTHWELRVAKHESRFVLDIFWDFVVVFIYVGVQIHDAMRIREFPASREVSGQSKRIRKHIFQPLDIHYWNGLRHHRVLLVQVVNYRSLGAVRELSKYLVLVSIRHQPGHGDLKPLVELVCEPDYGSALRCFARPYLHSIATIWGLVPAGMGQPASGISPHRRIFICVGLRYRPISLSANVLRLHLQQLPSVSHNRNVRTIRFYRLVYDDYLERTSGLANVSLSIRLCMVVYRDATCWWLRQDKIVVWKIQHTAVARSISRGI